MDAFTSHLLTALVVAVCTKLINDRMERRARVTAWLVNASAVHLPATPASPAVTAGIHSIVVQNNGRKTATRLRIGHQLAKFACSVFPDGLHIERLLPNGTREIEFERFVPGQIATLTYMYTAPTGWQDINAHLQSDDGAVQVVAMRPVPVMKPWQARFIVLLMAGGVAYFLSVAYFVYRAWVG